MQNLHVYKQITSCFSQGMFESFGKFPVNVFSRVRFKQLELFSLLFILKTDSTTNACECCENFKNC